MNAGSLVLCAGAVSFRKDEPEVFRRDSCEPRWLWTKVILAGGQASALSSLKTPFFPTHSQPPSQSPILHIQAPKHPSISPFIQSYIQPHFHPSIVKLPSIYSSHELAGS